MEIKSFLTTPVKPKILYSVGLWLQYSYHCQEHIDYFIIFFNGTGTLNNFLPKCQPDVKEVTTESKRLLPLRKLTSN